MSPTSTTTLLQEALALHRRGSTAEATARYAEVLRTDPTNADAHCFATFVCDVLLVIRLQRSPPNLRLSH